MSDQPTVTYERTFNLGNYQSERIGVSLPVPPDGTTEEAWAVARAMVRAEYERGEEKRRLETLNGPPLPVAPTKAEQPADLVLTFGKYKGLALGELVKHDSEYVAWLADKGMQEAVRAAAKVVLRTHDESERIKAADDIPF